MAYLYVTDQGVNLRKSGDRLILEKQGTQVLELECRHLDAVLIFGNVQFTTQACASLLANGIELSLLTRSGRLRGKLSPPAPKNILLRQAHYRLHDDPDSRLALSRTFLRAKLLNAAAVLRRYNKNHPDPKRSRIARRLVRDARRAETARNTQQLLGIEGLAARRYFDAFPSMLRKPLPFHGRSARPPRDPVNALLSLGYTLLANLIRSALDACGLDPYLGFFHSIRYGRPSLALDLLEELRHPLVDRFVLNLVNLAIVNEQSFRPPQPSGAVLLRPAALRTFCRSWETHLSRPFQHPTAGRPTTWHDIIREQVARLARAIRQSCPYQPFIFRP